MPRPDIFGIFTLFSSRPSETHGPSEQSAQVFYQQAMAFIQLGRDPDALVALLHAKRRDPLNEDINKFLVLCCQECELYWYKLPKETENFRALKTILEMQFGFAWGDAHASEDDTAYCNYQPSDTPPTCRACKVQGGGNVKLRKCAKCRQIRYCSVHCQKKDWYKHKRPCHQ